MGHSYDTKVTSPTCTSDGFTSHTCSRCNDTYNDSQIQATGHSYEIKQTDATCQADGYTEHNCTECGDFYKDAYVAKTAHRFQNGPCIYCETEQPTDPIVADTGWYKSETRVFTLSTAEQLAGLSDLVNSGTDFTNKVIYLGNDIDLEYLPWTPIGNEQYAFSGSFDGKGYTISSLNINADSSYLGLFGKVSGKISNFTIDNATVYSGGPNKYIAIACGYATNTVTAITVDGFIDAQASDYVGGVVGYTTSALSNLTSCTEIFGASYVGGIAGEASATTAVYNNLTSCGSIYGENYVAGITGKLTGSGMVYAELCSNYASVEGHSHISGIFGYISGKVGSMISSSLSSAKIRGEYMVGAIAAEAVNVTISKCSNDGSEIEATSCMISGDSYFAYLGGYVGKGYSVNNCINTASINYLSSGKYVGGIAGYLSHSVSDCENNAPISGYSNVGGIVGFISSTDTLNSVNLKNTSDISGTSYVGGIAGGWSYSATTSISFFENSGALSGTNHIGGIIGSITSSDKLITAHELINTGDVTATEHLVGGIFGYIDGSTSSVVNKCSSSASISGLYLVGGLIGKANKVAIKDCSNEGSQISANGFITEGTNNNVYLGGYVGYGAEISGCTNNADINYNSIGMGVGGIAGAAIGNVSKCENNGNISSISAKVGGIAGMLTSSTDERSYSKLTNTGNIIGTDKVGGIAGEIYQSINKKGTSYKNETRKHYYKVTVTISDINNSGCVSGNNNVGGLIGSMYIGNTYTSISHNCCIFTTDCYLYGDSDMKATKFTNNGTVLGNGNVGELIGYFDAELGSTITTYTITGSITKNSQLLEGEYAVGEIHDLTLSDRVIPETEEDTEIEGEDTTTENEGGQTGNGATETE